MCDLQVHRVNTPNRPFIATGVDYTGGTSTYKGYIAIFVCLAMSIARLFDPLGLIAPILILVKLIFKEVTMAHLHSENGRKHFLGWDDPVTSSIANKWKRFRVNLEDIRKI